ncbi:hypothetical protein GALMADRAFT_1121824 [Galerina marginata CBS 339.88]|uniref:Uncharacterized protein n=1 Tax=Galerina marginata (strain CBS 339.88) TaxID=685588 RepID=A0A067TCZ0_GALM3|nr:hypothetical protein GALMADRAFT_1121824 [Galerina marginata CBS 339.88]
MIYCVNEASYNPNIPTTISVPISGCSFKLHTQFQRHHLTAPCKQPVEFFSFPSVLVTHGHSESKVALDERDRGVINNAEVQTLLS